MAGGDRCGIGIRIDAQEARASVEGVIKVACPLFFHIGGETGTFYFFRSAESMESEGISLRVRERCRSNRSATRREMGPGTFRFSDTFFFSRRPEGVAQIRHL